MARMISAVGVAVGHLAFSLPAAAADVAAWCAVINYGEYWDCQYRSFEECRPNALAKRGQYPGRTINAWVTFLLGRNQTSRPGMPDFRIFTPHCRRSE
jgi:hypothetical protein